MKCSRCGHENLPQAKFCAKCGAAMSVSPPSPPPTPSPSPQPPPVPPAGTKLVYPKNPPINPNLSWLNLFIPGLSHFMMGQTMKGVVWLVGCFVLWAVALGWAVQIASAVDGYMVGKVLQSGRPVGEWQFFPK